MESSRKKSEENTYLVYRPGMRKNGMGVVVAHAPFCSSDVHFSACLSVVRCLFTNTAAAAGRVPPTQPGWLPGRDRLDGRPT